MKTSSDEVTYKKCLCSTSHSPQLSTERTEIWNTAIKKRRESLRWECRRCPSHGRTFALWRLLVSKTLLVLFPAREAETREDSTLNNSIKNLRWLPHLCSTCFLYFLFFFKVYEYCACIYAWVPHMCLVPAETRGRYQILWSRATDGL